MSDEAIVEVTDATFESEVLQSDQPVVVDFWADWCGPCRAVAPIIDELSEECAGQIKVAQIDVDSNPQTPSYYGIKSIPTFLKFIDGEVVDRLVGAVPRSGLEKLFAATLDAQ